MYRTGCLAGDGGGSSGLGEVIESLLPQRPYRAFQHAVEAGVQCPDSGCEMLGFDGGLQLRPPATQEPARGAPGQPHQLVHQLQLQFRRKLVVQLLDGLEGFAYMEYLPRQHIGGHYLTHIGTGGLLHAPQEGDAHVVDQVVGQLGGNDLAAQFVAAQRLGMAFNQLPREGPLQGRRQQRIVQHRGSHQPLLEISLGVADQYRQLRSGQALTGTGPLGQLFILGQGFQHTAQTAAGFHHADEATVLDHGRHHLRPGQTDGLGLLVVAVEHQSRYFVGHIHQQAVALLQGHLPGGHQLVEQDLDVDLLVGAADPAGVVDEVGVAGTAPQAVLNPAQLGHAEVAALAYHPGAHFAAIDPQAVIGLVAHVRVAFTGGLDIGADAAVPDQVDGGLEQAIDEFVGSQVLFGDIEDVPDLRAEGDLLELAGEHAATFGNQLRVVIGPARARQVVQALTLIKTATGIHRVGIDEDLQVVEGRQQAHRAGAQQTVAKYVTAHVTDTYDGNRILLHVYAQLAEMPLYRDPGTPGGNGHALVVVPHRATGGEGIAHPEAVVGGNAVGNVGEGRRALVRGHHQVIVIVIVTDHLRRRYHLAVNQIIGDIQQTLDEDAIAGDGLLLDSIATGLMGQTPRHETTLGAYGHDHRVLHLLGLGQPQHLGAVVLLPVGPAQTT